MPGTKDNAIHKIHYQTQKKIPYTKDNDRRKRQNHIQKTMAEKRQILDTKDKVRLKKRQILDIKDNAERKKRQSRTGHKFAIQDKSQK